MTARYNSREKTDWWVGLASH